MQVIAGSASIRLSEEIASIRGWDLVIPQYKNFSDGENYIRFQDAIQKEILVVQSLYYPQEFHLFQLLNLIQNAKRLGAERINVFTPYLCYARSDRVVLDGEAISSLTVLKLLEAVGVDHLIVLDIHNPAIIVKSCMKISNIFPIKAIKEYFKSMKVNLEEFQIIAPDEGAIERASKYAKALGLEYTNLIKTRDPNSGEIGVSIGEAEIIRKKVILIDDIMSTGSSLVEAASLLKLYDVKQIHIFVAHALGTSAVEQLLEIGNGEVIATSSIPSVIGKLSPAQDVVSLF